MSAVARVLRLALVGGGPGSFIGPVHRMAAELDGRIRLVAGAFSSDHDRCVEAGTRFGVAEDRCYADWRDMIVRERERPDGIDMVAIATPNHLHYPVAVAALEAGLHVMSDKPATASLEEAVALGRIAADAKARYALSYTYTGYPAVRAARTWLAEGRLGNVRKVVVEYIQGWLSTPLEARGDKQASWRVDPVRAGLGGCIADIGVHAFNIAEFVTGRRVEQLSSELVSTVAGRKLDDDCTILLRFGGGATGVLLASQVATGARNGLRLRVWGDKGGLTWDHEQPDRLELDWPDGTSQTLRAGAGGPAGIGARLPVGHPEGYIGAFATLYRDFADVVTGLSPATLLQGIDEGIRGMAFIETSVRSNGRGWTRFMPADGTVRGARAE